MKSNEVLIYINPILCESEDFSLEEIEQMTEKERYVWAKNYPSPLVEIFYTLDFFCKKFNDEQISDLGYIFEGETLI